VPRGSWVALVAALCALLLVAATSVAQVSLPPLPVPGGGGLTGDDGGGGEGGGGSDRPPGGGTGVKGPGGRCTPQIDGPNDPDYADPERMGQDTFNAEQWYLFDCIPQSAPLATDPEEAAGMSVNRAWREFGRGSKDVVVAYMEGGVNWRRPSAQDLRRQAYLNVAELPTPSCGKDDCDGDGVVTADDFKDDPRIKKPLLHEKTAGGITPEDLIVAFSDGRDDDANGYRDDISGWNFHRDTNDPQTDQSAYEHANGEQRVIAGEADNGKFGAGLCPNCRFLSVKLGDESIDRPDRIAEGIVYAVDAGAKVLCLVVASLGQSPEIQQAIDYAHDNGAVITWASNDFESADHQDGMRFARVWPGNGSVADQSNRGGRTQPNDALTTTFRSRSSVTSFGPHSLFSVSSTTDRRRSRRRSRPASPRWSTRPACSPAGPLDADEVLQVVRSTSSFIGRLPCPSCFRAPRTASSTSSTATGARTCTRRWKAVRDGRDPADRRHPLARLVPRVRPDALGRRRDHGAVAAKRSCGYRWEIQIAPGPEPRDDEFRARSPAGRGSAPADRQGQSSSRRGLPRSFWAGRYEAPTADRTSNRALQT
jgi:hypothetical protein